jgi:hypothetical protein
MNWVMVVTVIYISLYFEVAPRISAEAGRDKLTNSNRPHKLNADKQTWQEQLWANQQLKQVLEYIHHSWQARGLDASDSSEKGDP